MKKTLLVSIGLIALAVKSGSAATLYSENFESYTPSSLGPTSFGGFGQENNIGGTPWQIQGGGGGGGISVTAGVDNNGFLGSQGFFGDFDHSAATGFTFDQETAYGVIAAPGAGTSLAQIQISMDLFVNGSESSLQPVTIAFQNNGSEWDFNPTIVNGAYTLVTFTLDEATLSGTAAFDPTQSSNLRLQFGAGGFGFDNNNVVEMDNIQVQSLAPVPEPATLALGAAGMAGLMLLRRRKA